MIDKRIRVVHEIIEDLDSSESAAFQKLQANIDYASIDQKYQVFSCLSPLQGEGKTTVLLNLANLYALKDKKVIVLDLDFRAPMVHRYFKIPNEKGITDYLADKATRKEITNNVKPGLDIITRGPAQPFITMALESVKLASLIEELKKEYDYIFVDVAPVLLFADAQMISRFVDAFLLVASMGITKKNDLRETTKLIEQNKLNVLGVVISRAKRDSTYYNHYYNSEK